MIEAIASPNIAFIKYWGKKIALNDEDRNLALNASLSLTLSQAQTKVRLAKAPSDEFLIQGKKVSVMDETKIKAHIERVSLAYGQSPAQYFIDSTNNFPQGTGIASSASAFAALTAGLMGEILGQKAFEKELKEKLSQVSALARRASGSAARSVAGPFMKWEGESATVVNSDWKLFDSIVIFSRKPKAISSSEGHSRALSSKDFPARLLKLPERLKSVEEAIKKRSMKILGPLLEEEALEMHAIAQSSVPPIQYALPSTLKFIEALKNWGTDRNFFFTLDAGPNLHLISEAPIRNRIEEILTDLKLEAEIWEDWTGYGPMLRSSR